MHAFRISSSDKSLGWKRDNEWVYVAYLVPWDVFFGEFLVIFDEKKL